MNRFDYRPVAVAGAVLVTVSFAACALFVDDLFVFAFVFGVLGGE